MDIPRESAKRHSVILELKNSELEQAALDAERQLKAAEAEYNSLKAQLDSKLLDQRAPAARLERRGHHRNREPEGRDLCGPAGCWAAQQHGGHLQAG